MSDFPIPGQFVRFSSLSDGTLRLIIDVPHEYAHKVLDSLGFPRGQSVCVVLLEEGVWSASTSPTAEESRPSSSTPDREPARALAFATDIQAKPHRRWHELSRCEQACIRCGEERFLDFILDEYPNVTADSAADFVRDICGVSSRREIDEFPAAADRWDALDAQFREWAGLETEPRG